MQWVSWVASGFLVDSGGGLVHGGLGSVAGWLMVGLWGGLLRWCSGSCGLQVGFWLIPVGVWFMVGRGRLCGGSWWVCGVACRGGGGFVGWLVEVVQWVSWVAGGFLVNSGGGLVHGGSGSVAGWLVVGLWGGLLR